MSFQSFNRRPESEGLPPLLERARVSADERARIATLARELIAAMRDTNRAGSLGQFLQEYSLSSAEGIVLLSLAEALLRVPDAATEDLLIRDKLGSVDWGAHIGRSPSWLVNVSSFTLSLTGQLLTAEEAGGVLTRMVARLGEPVIRQAMRAAMHRMGDQFVMGRTIEKALERSRRSAETGFRHSFDMLGEGARTAADAKRYLAAYLHAVAVIGDAADGRSTIEAPGISVKLSALHPRYEAAQRDRVLRELTPIVIALAEAARGRGIGMTIDAEEAERLEPSFELFEQVVAAPSLKGWDGLGFVVQAYQKRAYPLIAAIEELGARHGRIIPVRLVKGAYWDTEIKRAQERGLADYPVFTRKAATDVSYLACARELLRAEHVFPAFATHNALTVATIAEWAGANRRFEFQRLHGMGEGLYEALLGRDPTHACRTYAPVGGHKDLLAYLARRLLENGANSSFVHLVQNDAASVDAAIADPVDAIAAIGATRNPRIPLPAQLYGQARLNSSGIDLGDRATLDGLSAELAKQWAEPWRAAPLIGGREGGEAAVAAVDPSDIGRAIGEVRTASSAETERAVALAAKAHPAWDAIGAAARAACLRRAADLLETRRTRFMAIAIREAGKTIPDALTEVREAVDFLRYYAWRAGEDFAAIALPGVTGEHNRLALAGRGVFACVSPWNFPLSIFLGQVAAALVAGNSVVAKPAPQTPIMAYEAVTLLHESGVPADVLHLVTGGAEIGKQLVAQSDVIGVAFTGSTGAAQSIARGLANRDGPIAALIAETGGQNAMIVDSSALPEQVVGDLVTSAFLSAGQRCSATRLLFVQEDVADHMLAMLAGAMDELRIGDPGEPATDIGPVIDEPALHRLESHLREFQGAVVHRLQAPNGGWFFGPAILGIDSPRQLKGEVFGPVLHVMRWRAGELGRVVDAINATRFGLTLGVHSRIRDTVDFVTGRARVGNIYVNRSMVGAVVGAQPFGGEGLSGTGPKAGGPNYLRRFATERVISIDTTSAGGNASLMAMDDSGVAEPA